METEFARLGRLASIRLNRPQALNALAPGQFSAIHRQLDEWAADPEISAVLVEGAGERAFCAGGDIRAVWDARTRQDDAFNRALFRDEYRLDRAIYRYSKPYVAFMDGIVMGGGAGVSVNGRFRVATERTAFAMPEAAIGFFPDVGATHFLGRCPGAIGLYLGLTGARLGAADMVWAGLATHAVPAATLDDLRRDLARAATSSDPADAIAATLDAAHRDPGSSALARDAEAIEDCFSAGSVEAILERLAGLEDAWAVAARAGMAKGAPTSLKVIVRQLTGGGGLEFDAAITREYGLACAFLAKHDFYEGIRAAVIDKDKAPKWQPAALEQVSPAVVDEFFLTAVDLLAGT